MIKRITRKQAAMLLTVFGTSKRLPAAVTWYAIWGAKQYPRNVVYAELRANEDGLCGVIARLKEAA